MGVLAAGRMPADRPPRRRLCAAAAVGEAGGRSSTRFPGSPAIDRETVSALVQAYAEGRVELGKVDLKTSKNHIRYAPGFIQGDALRGPGEHPYTAELIAAFLGWGLTKTTETLQWLEQIERDTVREEDVAGLPPTSPTGSAPAT